jgi:hypothetical protein
MVFWVTAVVFCPVRESKNKGGQGFRVFCRCPHPSFMTSSLAAFRDPDVLPVKGHAGFDPKNSKRRAGTTYFLRGFCRKSQKVRRKCPESRQKVPESAQKVMYCT